ncbi:MAG: hypothetical protein ABI818_02045 [Acidobacteriota bacterium]
MTRRDASLLRLRLEFGAGLIAAACVAAYVMGWLPWQADSIIATALALAYTYDLDRAVQRPRASHGRNIIRR